MTSQAERTSSSSCTHGFVVAMRAKLLSTVAPPNLEWVIVSRWGTEGEHLSLGWTTQPALQTDAPINLAPAATSLAVRAAGIASETPTTFHLASSLPSEITVAGTFVPAEGLVRLYGIGPRLRVRLKGQCLATPSPNTWHIEAVRAVWLGEFIEPCQRHPGCLAKPHH